MEFVDVEARLKTKKALESRYLNLLERAGTVEEMLSIERQIGTLRADIEATESRLRYLSNRSDYSMLSISYYKTIPAATDFAKRFKAGFVDGWDSFVSFLIWLVGCWPFLVLLAAALFTWRRWRIRKRRRAISPPEHSQPSGD